MALDVHNFLVSLAAAIAAATSPQLTIGGATPQLHVNRADETLADPLYTVLRIYGGSEPPVFSGMRVPSVRVQHDTRGPDASAVLARAWAVHEALIDPATGQSRMGWVIAGKRYKSDGTIESDPAVASGWLVRLINFLTVPGIVGQDGERSIATGNFQVDFELKS